MQPWSLEDQVSFKGPSKYREIQLTCQNLSLTLMFIFAAVRFSLLAAYLASIRGQGLNVGDTETPLSLSSLLALVLVA